MKVSIIIPFYKQEIYIEQAIVSLKKQSFKDFECILVDNNSVDNSRKIAEQTIRDDNRFRIINEPERGIDKALNRAISESKGEYISFLDADDWYHEDRLKLMVNEFDRGKYDIVVCKSWVIDERNGKKKEFPPYWFSERELPFLLFEENVIRSMSYIMIKRNSLLNISPFPSEYNLLLDYYIAVYSIINNFRIKFLNENLVFKRYHFENIAHDRFSSDYQDIKLTQHFFYNYPPLKTYFLEKDREYIFTRKYIRGASDGRRKGKFKELIYYMKDLVSKGFIKKEFYFYFSSLGILHSENFEVFKEYIKKFKLYHPFKYFFEGLIAYKEGNFKESLLYFGKAYAKSLAQFPEALNSYGVAMININKREAEKVFTYLINKHSHYEDGLKNYYSLLTGKINLKHTIFFSPETLNFFLYFS